MAEINEKELVTGIINGNEEAEKAFVEYYFTKIKLIVEVRIRNREDRQEIINDILMAAIINIREQKYMRTDKSSLTRYVHGIARNIINQYYKDFYGRAEKEAHVEQVVIERQKFKDYEQLKYEEKEESEQNRKIWSGAIAIMKPKYRKVIYLKFYENLSISKIAEIMDISNQKVSDYLKYSKKLLFNELRGKKL
jgi:RNA polymerase sigma factor (sigma-70 family)